MYDREELAKRLRESNRLLEERKERILEAGRILEEMGKVCDRTKSLIGSLDKMSVRQVVESHRTLSRAFKVLREDQCVMKECSCGKSYSPSEWYQLSLVGYQSVSFMGGELRNCSCNSTLLVITRR